MGVLTPFFNLFKPAKTDSQKVAKLNENFDIIDTEMHRPPLTVNGIEPDPTTRDIPITTVPLADNLTSDEAQINSGTYIERTSGGEASIADGTAWLSNIKGNMVKTGYVEESIQMSVTLADPTTETPISATLDHDTFIAAASSSGTYTFTYSNAWDTDPATYGITVTGTPVAGDKITVVYVKLNRGTITTASPTSFVSTGWNLYNHAAGYAQVVDYSDEYGFMIEGTYTSLKFAATLSGEQTTITPVDGYFTVPSDGFVFVTGGNDTDTEIWMTWSDWTEQANGGTFEAYTSDSIDLSGVMVDFPNGLMKIGNVYDEINLNVGKAYSRIERMAYTDENLEDVIASGVPYDTDTNYIYAVRVEPVVYTISLDGEYTVSDHGMEIFVGTSVPLTASSLYGNDLKGKLRRDVLTISEQSLTAAQQAQVQANLGLNEKLTTKLIEGNATDGLTINANNSGGTTGIVNGYRYNGIAFRNGSNNAGGIVQVDFGNATNMTLNRMRFIQNSPKATADTGNSGSYESYWMPAPDVGMSANETYRILTSKDFVVSGGSVAAGASRTYNMPLGGAILLVASARTANTAGFSIIYTQSNGNITSVPVSLGSNLTITTGTGTITIANSGNTYAANIKFLVLTDGIGYPTYTT